MGGHVEEEVSVLRGCVLRAVGSRVAHNHQDRLVRIPMLGLPEECQGAVGDQVREIVLGVVGPVLNLKRNDRVVAIEIS